MAETQPCEGCLPFEINTKTTWTIFIGDGVMWQAKVISCWLCDDCLELNETIRNS